MMKQLTATALAGALATLTLTAPAGAAVPAYRVLHSAGDREAPSAFFTGVIAGPDGTLYGLSYLGGANWNGAAYAIDPADGSASVVYAFRPGEGLNHLFDKLVRDSAGNLYGVAGRGGRHDLGTVFKIDATTHADTVLHTFAGGAGDGANPSGPLLLDPQGDLFGITELGGPNDTGTVFEISASGAERVVYAFGAEDSDAPKGPNGRLALDSAGHLYGTTFRGGTYGDGMVYELTLGNGTTAPVLKALYEFGARPHDSEWPTGVVLDAAHQMLYGVSTGGGADGDGTVFACPLAGAPERLVYSFQGSIHADGAAPMGAPVVDDAGMLYGTTMKGGSADYGTVFRVDPSRSSESVMHSFSGAAQGDGAEPWGELMIDAAGDLVGTTAKGGRKDTGTVFVLPS